MRERVSYLVGVSVRARLMASAICGGLSYMLLSQPINRWDQAIDATIGVGLAVLCVMAFVAALRLLWLKTSLLFWH